MEKTKGFAAQGVAGFIRPSPSRRGGLYESISRCLITAAESIGSVYQRSAVHADLCHPPHGIQNRLGNTCFIGTALQGFAACGEPILQYLREATRRNSNTAEMLLLGIESIQNGLDFHVNSLLPDNMTAGDHYDCDDWIQETFHKVFQETSMQYLFEDLYCLYCSMDAHSSSQQWIEEEQCLATKNGQPMITKPIVLNICTQIPSVSEIRLDEVVSLQLCDGSTVPYQLVAVLVHMGERNSGHYVAYRRGSRTARNTQGSGTVDDSRSWYKMDDSWVTKTSWDTVSALRASSWGSAGGVRNLIYIEHHDGNH